MDILADGALRLVEGLPAGEDEVGAAHQAPLLDQQLRRRAPEGRELVHAVIHRQARRQMARHGLRQGGVVPEHVRLAGLGDQRIEEGPLHPLHAAGNAVPIGQERRGHLHPLGHLAPLQPRQVGAGRLEARLLEVDHAPVPRGAGEQVLGALQHQIPGQVRHAEEKWAGGSFVRSNHRIVSIREGLSSPNPMLGYQ